MNISDNLRQNDGQKKGEALVGLSRCFKLHNPAWNKVSYKLYPNGEIKVQQTRVSPIGIKETNRDLENEPDQSETKNKKVTKKGRKAGKKVQQSEVKPHGKRSLRQSAHVYLGMSRKRRDRRRGKVTFLSLSFKRIIPDHKMAKEILKAFMQRWRSSHEELHYAWKAELQEGKEIDGQMSYRYFHGAALHFHILTPHFLHKDRLNKLWNEVVANRFKEEGLITDSEFDIWMYELEQFLKYGSYKKALFLLTPNVKGLNRPASYMAKYVSKKSGLIDGNIWFVSKATKKLILPDVVEDEFQSQLEAERFIEALHKECSKAVKGIMHWWADFTNLFGFFSWQGKKLIRQINKFRKNYMLTKHGIIG